MNKFMSGLQSANNVTLTTNGAIARKTTNSDLLDLFGMGAAYRQRSDEDCILLFKKAFEENPVYALKCLFYIRDVRGGQGERRFFRVVMKWLAKNETDTVLRNLRSVPEFGRWDDLYVFVGTPVEAEAMKFIKEQLALDVQCKAPSLLAKWLKSENTSSSDSVRLGNITRKYLGMSHKQYRKTLSILRTRINVLEKLMSENRWDEIEFDKIPSRAGMIYKNAFARHDLERMKSEKAVQSYEDFAKDTTTKVNAKALYPYEVVAEATKVMKCDSYGWYGSCRRAPIPMDDTNRLMVNKYWENLADYFKGAAFDGLAVVNTSGSMTGSSASAPINVAISLGLYCAEKARGPFAGHYVSFSSRPQLIATEGVDFCDKVKRIYETNLCENTNIEATFDMLLDTAIRNNCTQDDLPKNLIIISDMQFDQARGYWGRKPDGSVRTLMESIEAKWNAHGYQMPTLTFWYVNAFQQNVPMEMKDGVNFVSGMSPSLFEQIMSGKNGYDLMMDKLDSERYACIK